MNEMVEKVADVLNAVLTPAEGQQDREHFVAAARAAIQAMRLPDDAWLRSELTSNMVEDFNFMIDLALNEKSPPPLSE